MRWPPRDYSSLFFGREPVHSNMWAIGMREEFILSLQVLTSLIFVAIPPMAMTRGCWSCYLDLSYTNHWPDNKDGIIWTRFDLNQWLWNWKHHTLFQKLFWAVKILLYFLPKGKDSKADKEALVLWSGKSWIQIMTHYQKPEVFQWSCAKPCSAFHF